MGPYAVVTDDADLFRKANSTSKDNGYTKPAWYAAFKMDGKRENLITERDEVKVAKMRSKVAMGVSISYSILSIFSSTKPLLRFILQHRSSLVVPCTTHY